MNGAEGYRAFISYSHRDARWGEWLHRRLETYRIPKAIVGRETPFGAIPERLAPIFRDRDELAAATDLSAEIAAALQRALFLVVLCSPAAAQSKWVNEEIKTFKRLHGEDRVRAIIVDGAPFSGDPQTECFPEALRFRFRDGAITEEKAEPIAADLREGGDGKKYAISKLVAGLVGARLDDLVRRENARRAARMRAAVAGMSAVAASLGGLAVYAFQQRDVAVKARAVAETERAEAQTAREGAEGLVEFMLTDLRKRLDAVGRLDVLDSVGKRALAYYDARDLARADPDALGRRARAQLLVGEIDNLRGDLPAALSAYEAAAKTTEELLKRDPDNEQRIFDHAQSVFWVGYIAWQRGDADAAKMQFTLYHDLAQRLVALNPDKDEWQAELDYAFSNLGTLAMDQGDVEGAEQYFRKSLEISTALSAKAPGDVERALAAAQSHAWLAHSAIRQLKYSEARALRHGEAQIYFRLLADDTENAFVSDKLIVTLFTLAQLDLEVGALSDAEKWSRSALEIALKIYESDPANTKVKVRLAFAATVRADVLLYDNRGDQAAEILLQGARLSAQLLQQESPIPEWIEADLRVRIGQARIACATGNITGARSTFSAVVRESKALTNDIDDQTVASQLHIAALASAARCAENPRDGWGEVIASSQGLQSLAPLTLAFLVEAHLGIGDLSKASELAGRLYSAGFRHPDFVKLTKSHPELLTNL